MSHKIYISGNLLYIIDNANSLQYEGIARDCLHRRELLSSTSMSFTGVNGLSKTKLFEYADIQDQNGDPMTDAYPTIQEFSDYLDTQLGKSSGGGNGFDGVVLDEKVISSGGTLTIPSNLSNYGYLRLEVEDAGGANSSLAQTVKADAVSGARLPMHPDNITGYVFFDINVAGTLATLTATINFSGTMTARVIGLEKTATPITPVAAREYGSNANGSYIIDNATGTIEQWGTFNAVSNGIATITFPTPFLNGSHSPTGNSMLNTAKNHSVKFLTRSSTNMTASMWLSDGFVDTRDAGLCSWRSIGLKP